MTMTDWRGSLGTTDGLGTTWYLTFCGFVTFVVCYASRTDACTGTQSEQHVASADGHDTTGQYAPAWHGNGPLLTSLPGWPSPIDSRVLATAQELPDQFPFDEEMNDGTPLGVGWLQSTIGHSVRSSSATAYLSADVQARSNLDIMINTRATRLVQTGTSGGVPEFKAVEVAENSSGQYVSTYVPIITS